MAALENCRSCHKPVRFIETLKGATAILDPDPVPNGNVMIGHDGRARFARTKVRQCAYCGCTEQDACPDGQDLLGRPKGCCWIEPDRCSACVGREPARYVVHHVTCPDAAAWSKPGSTAAAVGRVRQAARQSNELERTATRDALEGGPEAAMERRRPR
jgi:hypothetical protein